MLTISRRAALALAATLLPAAADAEPATTLSFWHNHPEWKDRVIAILNRFQTEHPNIRIELQEMPTTAYTARMQTALAAGEAPDILSLRAGGDVYATAKAGSIADLTGKLDISSLTADALEASRFDGRIYGVPMFGKFTVALFYNRDLFAKHGVTPPATWEALTALCGSLKAKGVVPMICPAQDLNIPGYTYMLLASGVLGADGFKALCAGQRKLTDPDLLAAAAYFKQLYPFYQPGAIGTAYTEGKALFALGRGAMMVAGSADYAGFTAMNPKANLGVVPFPAPPGGKQATNTGMQSIFAINSKTKAMPEALAFMQWMLSKPAAQMVLDTITLSTSRDVQVTGDRVMREVMAAAAVNDIRVFFEIPQVTRVFSVAGTLAQPLFLGELSVDAFAAKVQDSIDPSANW